MRTRLKISALAAVIIAMTNMPGSAQVREAVYRGTMVCEKLPFTVGNGREAIEVTVSASSVRYKHAVRLHGTAAPTAEQGNGALNGDTISLQGSWTGGNRRYDAKYSGTFVRRHAHLTGTQTWKDGGKTITRACSGSIKRPFRVFLPREKK
jgi:hypothetical protein